MEGGLDKAYDDIQWSDAEEHGNEHDEAQHGVDDVRPPHCSRHDDGCVGDFFGDVYDRVGAETGVHDIDLRDEVGGAGVVVSAVVGEGEEDVGGAGREVSLAGG